MKITTPSSLGSNGTRIKWIEMPMANSTTAYLEIRVGSSGGFWNLNWAGVTWTVAVAFSLGTVATSKEYHIAMTYDPSNYIGGSSTSAPDLNASGTNSSSGGAQTNSDLKFYVKNITDSGSWSLPNFSAIEDNWYQNETIGILSTSLRLGPASGGGSATAIQLWNKTLTYSDLP